MRYMRNEFYVDMGNAKSYSVFNLTSKICRHILREIERIEVEE